MRGGWRSVVRVAAAASAVALAGVLSSCASTGPESAFTLAFEGDGSFHVYDGGAEVRLAVLLVPADSTAPDSVVARDSAIVSALADPSFSFTFEHLLVAGETYRVDTWINTNGNRKCDPPPTDHQWRVNLGRVTGAVRYIEADDESAMTDVCATFEPPDSTI